MKAFKGHKYNKEEINFLINKEMHNNRILN